MPSTDKTLPISSDLHVILNSIAEGVVVLDSTGRVLLCNGAAQRILGLPKETIESGDLAKPQLLTIHEDGSPLRPEQWPANECLRTGVSIKEVVLGVGHGETDLRWVLVSAEPLRHELDGPLHGVVATFTDITTQVRQRKQLEALTKQLSYVLEGSTDGYFDVHVPSGAMQFSARCAAMFGYTLGELDLHLSTFERLAHPDDLPTASTAVERVYRGEAERFSVEVRVRHKDGRWIWVIATGKLAERDGQGLPLRLTGAFSDITARKEAEARLFAAQTQLRYAFEGSNDGLADWDIRANTVDFNPRWAAMIGCEINQVEASFETFMRRVHPDDLEPLKRAVEQLLSGEIVQFENEQRVQRHDGRWISVLARGRIVERDADGTPLRAAGVMTDVTARRQAEAVLRASLAENERLVNELRQALDEVKTLSALLPICTFCKKVRDDAGYWHGIEQYITAHTDTLFSHGMCPACLKTYYPGYS